MSVKRSPTRSNSFSEGSLPSSTGTKFSFKPPLLSANGVATGQALKSAPEAELVAQNATTSVGNPYATGQALKSTPEAEKVAQNATTSVGSPKKAPKKIQVGIDRYLPKRKLSPQQGNPTTKVSRTNDPSASTSANLGNNRFASLAIESTEPKAPNPPKPPPIYLREESSNALVKKLTELIGKGSFHIVPIKRGTIHETKIQVYSESFFRAITKHLGDNKKNYYTYRLKSSKGLVVVIKGIESNVDSAEIKEALEIQGFKVNSVFNIFNRDKKPQPMFKVELMPDTAKLKKNETHPIYRLEFLLHRKITVEEPHKRSGPMQCMNCQEFGHSKAYCTLRTVCVVCGDLHHLSMCTKKGSELASKKCSNCGGNHTANYRGCLVYKDLKNKLRQKINVFQTPAQGELVFSSKYQSSKGSTLNVPQQLVHTVSPGISYANAVKMGNSSANSAPPIQGQTQQPTVVQTGIEATILNFTQCMTQFMTSMQSMIQNFMASQTQMLQAILSKK